MGVHTGLVGEEIFVDSEGSSDSTVGHDLRLDVVDVGVNAVSRGSEVLIISIDAA